MKHLKLFEDYEYSKENCPGCNCTDCVCRDEFSEEETIDDTDEFGDNDSDGDDFVDKFTADDEEEVEFEYSDQQFESAKKKSKNDFLKKIKAKKENDNKKKEEGGLTAAQKKLPAGLRAAIARKAAKKNPKD